MESSIRFCVIESATITAFSYISATNYAIIHIFTNTKTNQINNNIKLLE